MKRRNPYYALESLHRILLHFEDHNSPRELSAAESFHCFFYCNGTVNADKIAAVVIKCTSTLSAILFHVWTNEDT